MLPSTSPPAIKPREYSSLLDPGFPQDNRLKRSLLAHSPTTGSSHSSEWKSNLKISKLADELKDRSTAPAIVPAARWHETGENAADADREAPLMHAMVTDLEDPQFLTIIRPVCPSFRPIQNPQNPDLGNSRSSTAKFYQKWRFITLEISIFKWSRPWRR